ncbi:putative DNA helicase [Dioscorea sansibarensis]
MARSKEALVLLLDVGPSMHSILPEVEKLCTMLVQKKLMFNKNHEVGVVLFGTEEAKNELEKEVGGYENVFVLRDIKVVDGDLVDVLHNIPRGKFHGDFIDVIVVGIDMLMKKFGETNKGKQCLCLVTNAQYPIKDPYEGTKEDQVDLISAQMKANGIKFDCVVIRENPIGSAEKSVIDKNDHLLNQFSKKTISKIVHVDNPLALLGSLRTRSISPVTVFRGDLELGSTMKIKVWVYKKTSEEKFPTLKKYSDKAPSSDKFATHEVKVDFEYKSVEDPDKVVPPEQRIKGYCYGPQVIPVSSAEWDSVKFKPDKGVKLLGFTDSLNIKRHYYMKDVYTFIPEPGNRKAIVAVSAIARVMKELNKVAILRCVWKQGQGSVVIGVLSPNISCTDNIPDSCYFNILPFAEDVREFQFPSFSRFPAAWLPNAYQQEAADNFVRMLDLAPSDRDEMLKPEFTPNPVLERFYRYLDLKAKQPDAGVPPLDRTLKRITEPENDFLFKRKFAIDDFHSHFELKENPKKKKPSRLAWKEKPSSSVTEASADGGTSDIQRNLVQDSSVVKVEKIGDLNPIQDFEAMIARRDNPNWVMKAIQGMRAYINDLLENSCRGDTFPKAIECLAALRKGCILEQEPKEFNRFLFHLYDKWKTTDLLEFFKILPSKKVTLITKTEAADSDVTEEEAKNFPLKPEPSS